MVLSPPLKVIKPASVTVGLDRIVEAADRLAASEENAFLCSWLPSLMPEVPPAPIAVRHALALRATGRLDEARTLLGSLPKTPTGWATRDVARLEHERAWFSWVDGQHEAARGHVSRGLAAMVGDARAGATPELVDLYVVEGRLESANNRLEAAERAFDHAAHVAERLPPGPWRVQIEVSIGYQRFSLGRPLEAHEAFVRAAEVAPPASASAISAMQGDALALASLGRFDEARTVALEGIELSGRVAVRWRLSHLWDCLGVVEHMADRPHAALRAYDEAYAVLGAETQDTLRFSILAHRTETLAMLGRTRAAEQARTLAEGVYARMAAVAQVYEAVWAVAQARLFEARGEFAAVRQVLLPVVERSRHYRVGDALLGCARAALGEGKVDEAREFAERACLLGFESGCIFPGRKHNLGVWALALTCRDSRAVRFADSMLKRLASERALPPDEELSSTVRAALQNWQSSSAARPVWITTRNGVARVSLEDARTEAEGGTLSVDMVAHEVRVGKKVVALTRHRALEPLLVQMLRRAEHGLAAEDILMAAGGPGPGSADADHRVRVLVSRLRALLGAEAPIVTARAAGEGARAHYRLAAHIGFALIEPVGANDEKSANEKSANAPNEPKSVRGALA